MSEVFVGLLQPFGFPFAPRDWMLCNGAILPISQYQALYALIGNTYGGDGVNTFAIPDTRGRTLVGQGHLPGGQTYAMGESGGLEAYTLTEQNLPMHTHMLMATDQGAAQ
ncbi:MAG: phage tail protein, partial [Brevundimonas sp.]